MNEDDDELLTEDVEPTFGLPLTSVEDEDELEDLEALESRDIKADF